VRVLGVYLDPALKWGPHINKIKEKMSKQTLALTRTAASTWGATFKKAKHIYTAVIRPAITFGHAVWHNPDTKSPHYKSHSNQLKVIQNRCLRTITGAFKSTPTNVLEAEAGITPIDIHLNYQQARTRERLQGSNTTKIIHEACRKIKDSLHGRRGRRKVSQATPGEKKNRWATKVIEQATAANVHQPNRRVNTQTSLQQHFQNIWQQRWEAYRQKVPPNRRTPAQQDDDLQHRWKLHEGASKGESSLMIQIRTEQIGLRAYLAKRKVPGIGPECDCGEALQTLKHIVLACPNTSENRTEWLQRAGTTDYRVLTSTKRGLRMLARRIMEQGILHQFSIAREMVMPLGVS